MRFGWDGFFKMAVGVSFLVVIGMMIWIASSGKKTETGISSKNTVLPATEDGELLKLHWVKEKEYFVKFPGFIKTSSITTTFFGKLKSISENKVVLEKDGKIIELANEIPGTKTTYFDTIKNTNNTAKLISLKDFNVGDNVEVEIDINRNNGKTFLKFVWRFYTQ